VGHGVAMRGAPDDVRAASLYEAPGVEEEGAAQMLEALVLAGADAPRNAERFRIGGPRP
jgi:hydroxymethylpyrimidine pyrophosphatase-like HAD family hydrolase